MNNILDIIHSFDGKCACGMTHTTAIRDVRVGSGLVHEVGQILKENDFPKKLLVVADKKTLAAADGILTSLRGFDLVFHIYDDLRVAEMRHVNEVERLLEQHDCGVISVGSGSLNDTCRLASARQNKPFCIFATAPSMDGFASYSSPIVADGFKSSYPAKSPEVIIGDTKILAAAPVQLKSAGFGDMIAKYTGLADWKISSLLTDEIYCERVAELTRSAVDRLMDMADRVTANDEETAGEIFSSLLLTGIGMSFMQNSRPASGSEHIIAHLIECKELPDGIIPNFHGEDVGVCTLETLKMYKDLVKHERITAVRETVDWEDVYSYYGSMADDVKKLNTPTTITDEVSPADLEAKWPLIRQAVEELPSYDACLSAMRKAGCKLTHEDIGKPRKLMDDCIKYSPYMRRRLTLLRLLPMIRL